MNRRTFVTTSSLAALGTLFVKCSGSSTILLKKNQVIACLGDSVTYAGKDGYVERLQKYTDTNCPQLNLKFLNWGKNSETITGLTEEDHPGPRPYLFNRLDGLLNATDVDVIFFCFGINCGIYGKPSPQLFDSYKIGIYSFLEKIKLKKIQAVLLTPPPLALKAVPLKKLPAATPFSWKNPYPLYEEEVLQEFKKIVLEVKHSNLLGTIDIHTPLLKNQTELYTDDPIHPNPKGHELIAGTVIDHLRF
ncbi:SGNH/GDSL hydrolase family protein [Maribacter sp. 2210JD10-5]|uniref:SGNH/GDSL hydrolase family protein n=1 Tax=Maribacter sp. 2210JD10-5 TaxID=3386272 RepID=UPI0039BC6154